MIIWGLDLNRIRFSAFKHSNMFDPKYYLRSRRFIAYQLAMIFTVVGESTATYTLDKYLKLQRAVQNYQPGASLYNNDVVGVGSFTIFAGVYTATVFGTMFFFLLFWPALAESVMWFRIKAAGSIFAVLAVLGAAISSTVVVATHKAYLIPSPNGDFEALQAAFAHPRPPYVYRTFSYIYPWLILTWIGWLFTIWSTYLVFQASHYHLANPHVVGEYLRQEEDEKKAKV
jgi:hypothetical protein